jgi:hypothetical protein
MAHYAELDQNDVVLRVIVVDDACETDDKGKTDESLGIAWCENFLGGTWIKTSYNRNIRKNYAGPGMIYKRDHDLFITRQPFPSWTLDPNKGAWVPPIPQPHDLFHWDEQTHQWLPSS